MGRRALQAPYQGVGGAVFHIGCVQLQRESGGRVVFINGQVDRVALLDGRVVIYGSDRDAEGMLCSAAGAIQNLDRITVGAIVVLVRCVDDGGVVDLQAAMQRLEEGGGGQLGVVHIADVERHRQAVVFIGGIIAAVTFGNHRVVVHGCKGQLRGDHGTGQGAISGLPAKAGGAGPVTGRFEGQVVQGGKGQCFAQRDQAAIGLFQGAGVGAHRQTGDHHGHGLLIQFGNGCAERGCRDGQRGVFLAAQRKSGGIGRAIHGEGECLAGIAANPVAGGKGEWVATGAAGGGAAENP